MFSLVKVRIEKKYVANMSLNCEYTNSDKRGITVQLDYNCLFLMASNGKTNLTVGMTIDWANIVPSDRLLV